MNKEFIGQVVRAIKAKITEHSGKNTNDMIDGYMSIISALNKEIVALRPVSKVDNDDEEWFA